MKKMVMEKVNFQDEEFLPKCPYCGKELDRVKLVVLGGATERHIFYACPYCQKLIGTSFDVVEHFGGIA